MMRALVLLSTLGLLAGIASASPIPGTYKSPDAGNDFLSGRWSESYVGGSQGAVGNAMHAASWDQATSTLAGQWELSAPAISATPTLLMDTVNAFGNGIRVYSTTHTGGTVSLMNTGPWWLSGDPGTNYLFNVVSLVNTTTMVIQNGQVTTWLSVADLTATYQADPKYAISFALGSVLPLGIGSNITSEFPAFVGAGTGDWGAVQKMTMEITDNYAGVPEPATLGLLVMGGLAFIRRRR